jgi:hypothetical protein
MGKLGKRLQQTSFKARVLDTVESRFLQLR